jgi:hypothetical protein
MYDMAGHKASYFVTLIISHRALVMDGGIPSSEKTVFWKKGRLPIFC